MFDITGGILTTVGLLFAGVSVGLQKRKIINGYQAEIAKGRLQMEEEVSNKLKTYIQHIKIRIDDNFDNFDDMLQQEEKQIANLQSQQQNIDNRLKSIKDQLQAMSEGTLTKD